MAASNRLYPPVIDYAMPAFVIDESTTSTRIYFSLPVYNSRSEIQSAHITVRYLSDNSSALKTAAYPARIKVANIGMVTAIEDPVRASRQDKYYIELLNDDLENGFETGIVYKIQLRFSKLNENVSGSGPSAGWFNQNYAQFSEWSTVSLIRPIEKPEYTILGLEEADKGASVSFASLDSIFTVEYNQGSSHEPLKAWQAKLYSKNKAELLIDSGEVIYNTYNYLAPDEQDISAFDIVLPYQMEANKDYVLEFYIETRNGYTQTSDFAFTCILSTSVQFDGTIDLNMNPEEGYALVKIHNLTTLNNNLIIRRTSSESNFSIWEDIAVQVFANTSVNWDFKDFTIESGIWYRYGVQIRDTRGRRGAITPVTDIQMCEFNHVFLLGPDGRQLKLKYDFNISSANITVSEAKTDTIGSRYPFVRRNGNMYYRTFQCTGLISGYYEEDNEIIDSLNQEFRDDNPLTEGVTEEKLFTNITELFHHNENRYKEAQANYNQKTFSYDYTYEREFREKVQEFLYDDKVKLFKSLQEGNILVKLMNISLTPKNELDRLMYTFSAQAIEIGEPTLVNLNDYGLQIIGEYVSSIDFAVTKLGQLSSFNGYDKDNNIQYLAIPANTNIIDKISEQFGWSHNNGQTSVKPINNTLVRDFQLTHLKVEFESPPYLIEINGNTLTPFNGSSTIGKNLTLGWLLNINNTTILIKPPNNYYELKEPGLVLDSSSTVSSPNEMELSVYYTVDLEQEVNNQNVPISLSYYNINGQLQRIFKPDIVNENVVRLLQTKYGYTYGNTQWTFGGLITADIEAEPGVAFLAKSNVVENATLFIMNETGNLYLDPGIPNVKIDTLQFVGRQIDLRYQFADKEAFDEKHQKDNIINTPLDFDYYLENTKIKMFYRDNWYSLNEDSELNDLVFIIKCPVEAIINYQIQQEKGVYEQL